MTKSFETKFVDKRDPNFSMTLLLDKVEKEEDMIYGLFVNLFNTFCQSGGLTAVYEIISSESLIKKANKVSLANYKLPLDIVAMLLSPFRSIKSIAKEEILSEFAGRGEKAFFQRLESLEEKEIKDINKESMSNAMQLMKGFIKLKHPEEQASKIIETHEMMLSLKYLQTPYLEKRLNGLADIKKLIDKVTMNSQMPNSSCSSWVTADYLSKWIVSNNILGKILNENTHAELVKRTSSILIFLAKTKAITRDMIESLWKFQKDQHEDIIRVVYDTIKDIIDYLSVEVIILLFNMQ